MTCAQFAAAALLCFALVPGSFGQTSTAITYNYAKLAYPGARLTLVNGINNNNVIVGEYFDSSDNVHGFVYRQGKFTSVNVPGSTATQVMGINDLDDIVGVYQQSGPLNSHGFLRHNGTFKTIDDPAAQFGTTLFGINRDGTIVGSFDDAHGFIYQNGVFRTRDARQASGEPPDTQLNAISNLGEIVGQVFTGGIWRGFWIKGKDFDFLEPSGARDSQVTGVNGHGDVVGCHDANAGFISFAVEQAEGSADTERFPVQQKLASCAAAVNYSRVVVGSYFTVQKPYGFLAVPALTFKVSSPVNHSSLTNPVRVVATAFGNNPISRIEIWVNFRKIFQVNETSLNTKLNLPTGPNQRFVIQAVDSKGLTTKVVDTITVR